MCILIYAVLRFKPTINVLTKVVILLWENSLFIAGFALN